MKEWTETDFSYDENGNFIATYTEKLLTEVRSNREKETLKAIYRYCEENGYIPNIIDKDKLELVLKLGIAELEKRGLD